MNTTLIKLNWPAIGLLAGTIIGAGVFSLPFIFYSAGVWLGLAYLVGVSLIYVITYWLYADIILRTGGEHRFVGYAQIYLGEFGFWLANLAAVFGSVLSMTVYLILAPSFAKLLGNFGSFEAVLVFWLLGTLTIFASLRRFALVELLITLGMLAIIVLLFGLGAGEISRIEFSQALDWASAFLPLGAVLFSLSGLVAIAPLVKLIGRQNVLSIRTVIFVGILLSAILYGLFALAVIGLSGTPSADAVSGLAGKIPEWVLAGVGVLGILALWSSYIAVGLNLRDVLRLDFNWHRFTGAVMVTGAPLVFYFAGLTDFITLISFIGGIFLALEGILIILMWQSARQKFYPALIFLAIPFLAAILYEIIKLL